MRRSCHTVNSHVTCPRTSATFIVDVTAREGNAEYVTIIHVHWSDWVQFWSLYECSMPFSYGLKWSSTTNGLASWLYSNWQQHDPKKKRYPKCPTAETRSPKTVSQMPSAFNLHLHSEWHCLCRRQCQCQRQRQPVKCYKLTIELKGATHAVCLEPMRAASMHKTKNLSSNTKGTDYYDRMPCHEVTMILIHT